MVEEVKHAGARREQVRVVQAIEEGHCERGVLRRRVVSVNGSGEALLNARKFGANRIPTEKFDIHGAIRASSHILLELVDAEAQHLARRRRVSGHAEAQIHLGFCGRPRFGLRRFLRALREQLVGHGLRGPHGLCQNSARHAGAECTYQTVEITPRQPALMLPSIVSRIMSHCNSLWWWGCPNVRLSSGLDRR